MKFQHSHLAYCTNIHPAETWAETERVLKTHVLAVRDLLRRPGPDGSPALLPLDGEFGIGLRLSAVAARELLEGDRLAVFKDWLEETRTYVFTINGFPYGSFHGTRVKERVFQPDWTEPARLEYTKDLFRILAAIARPDTGASVSTLPGSHKSFRADESLILVNLYKLSEWIDNLSFTSGIDLHLGLEPEPLGYFENTIETIALFDRFHTSFPNSDMIRRRIGVNYDACHFALEYDDARTSLDALKAAGIRISKIHLSSALAIDPRDPAAIEAIRAFDEPTYFHQVLVKDDAGIIRRFMDLPDFLSVGAIPGAVEARVHFHVPLDAEPAPPLRSTRDQVREVLAWKNENPGVCPHYEIETYTWGVLPGDMRRPVEQQIAGEYRWVLAHSNPPSSDCAAIIVAAGSSRRMGMDKLAWPLAGVSVLRRTIDAFLACPGIASVVVVCPEDRWKLMDSEGFSKPVMRVDGGETRQDSVALGLAAMDSGCRYVAVHDGARPLVSPDDIARCVEAAMTHRAASLARRVTETMKRSDSVDFCAGPVDRENLWSMETPQVFEVSLLREAYTEVAARKLVVTDEVSAVEALGVKVKLIESLHPNLKITTPADLTLAEALMKTMTS